MRRMHPHPFEPDSPRIRASCDMGHTHLHSVRICHDHLSPLILKPEVPDLIDVVAPAESVRTKVQDLDFVAMCGSAYCDQSCDSARAAASISFIIVATNCLTFLINSVAPLSEPVSLNIVTTYEFVLNWLMRMSFQESCTRPLSVLEQSCNASIGFLWPTYFPERVGMVSMLVSLDNMRCTSLLPV